MRFFTDSPYEKMMMDTRRESAECPSFLYDSRKPWEDKMAKLVIAEKPSVAASIAAVLGARTKKEGCYEGNGYIVSWCLGHLAELAQADSYNPRFKKWSREDLPIIPDSWKLSVSEGKEKQLRLLKRLMDRSDVTELINACDAGREGELIFRNVYRVCGCRKPVLRLWLSSMEDEAICDGFLNLKPQKEYDLLYEAAQCRAEADWLVGINASRLFSVLYHRKLCAGRVMSPTLTMLSAREEQIRSFAPEKYWTLTAEPGGVKVKSERFSDKGAAEKAAAELSGKLVILKSSITKKRMEKAPRLYDLTTLQRDANRILGYTAQQTLDYAQSLYEKKLCTYPRTDSRWLTDDVQGRVPELAAAAAMLLGVKVPDTVNVSQICCSSKVSDHPALVPTLLAEKGLASASAGEKELLMLIASRLLCAVSGPFLYDETEYVFECGEQKLSGKAKQIVSIGWREFSCEDTADRFADMAPIADSTVFEADTVSLKEEETEPPKHYTEDTILAAMDAAGAKNMPEDCERRGIGTPATRAGIIEKLIESGYAERRRIGRSELLMPTDIGRGIVAIMPDKLKSPLLTAEWETRLKAIEHGEESAEQFLKDISAMLTELVSDYSPLQGAEVLFPSGRAVIGKCPRCGSNVTEGRQGFFCEHNECRFGIWNNSRYFSNRHINLNSELVRSLLANGRVHLDKIYSMKTGKYYSADLVMTDDGFDTFFSMDFPDSGR